MQITLKLSDSLIKDILNMDKTKSFNTAVNDLLAYAISKAAEAKESGGIATADILPKDVADIYAEDLLALVLSSEDFDEGVNYAVSDFYHLITGAPAYSALSMGDKQRIARSFATAIKKQNAEELKLPRMEILKSPVPKKFRILKGNE